MSEETVAGALKVIETTDARVSSERPASSSNPSIHSIDDMNDHFLVLTPSTSNASQASQALATNEAPVSAASAQQRKERRTQVKEELEFFKASSIANETRATTSAEQRKINLPLSQNSGHGVSGEHLRAAETARIRTDGNIRRDTKGGRWSLPNDLEYDPVVSSIGNSRTASRPNSVVKPTMEMLEAAIEAVNQSGWQPRPRGSTSTHGSEEQETDERLLRIKEEFDRQNPGFEKFEIGIRSGPRVTPAELEAIRLRDRIAKAKAERRSLRKALELNNTANVTKAVASENERNEPNHVNNTSAPPEIGEAGIVKSRETDLDVSDEDKDESESRSESEDSIDEPVNRGPYGVLFAIIDESLWGMIEASLALRDEGADRVIGEALGQVFAATAQIHLGITLFAYVRLGASASVRSAGLFWIFVVCSVRMYRKQIRLVGAMMEGREKTKAGRVASGLLKIVVGAMLIAGVVSYHLLRDQTDV